MMKIFRQLNPTSLHPITYMYAVKNNTTVDGEVSVNQPPFGFFHLNEVWVQRFDELRLITHLDFGAKCGGECFCQNIMFI